MELFFISSPVGLLQIQIKENQLYSLGQIQKTPSISTLFETSPCLSFLQKQESPIKSGKFRQNQYQVKTKLKIQKFNQELPNFYPHKPLFDKINFLKIKPNKNKSFEKKPKSLNQVTINSENFLNKRLSYLVDEEGSSILKQQKKSILAKNISQQLNLYFEGRLKKFQVPIYNRGTDFQKKVWLALRNIPWGHTKKYSQIAKALKKPRAYRAVGNSCGKNPFLIVVPCHRVLSHSGLGGFALGLQTKKYLLNLEKKSD